MMRNIYLQCKKFYRVQTLLVEDKKGGSRATMEFSNDMTLNHCRTINSTNSIFIFGVSYCCMVELRISTCFCSCWCWKTTIYFTDPTSDVGSHTIFKTVKLPKFEPLQNEQFINCDVRFFGVHAILMTNV